MSINQELAEDHPLWMIDWQIKDLLEGIGATEDHEDVLAFLRSTGVAESTVVRVHRAIVSAERKQITFEQFRNANRVRCLKWHPAGIESWSNSDWLTAIMGELGELASLIKMRNRERDGLPGNKFSPTNEQIAKEAADVFTYLDLFCERNGIDLGTAAVEKFNEVSARVGFPDRIEI